MRRCLSLAALAAVATLAGCAPKADFTVSSTAGDAPLTVTFTDQSQPLFLGLDISAIFPIIEWTWDFGDLTTASVQNASHEYKEGGEYTVSLTVRNFFGSNTLTKPKLINVKKDLPTARFTATVGNNDVRAYTFADTSLPGSGTIGSRQWEFGDGTFSTDTNPVHSYAAPGVYTAVLIVCTPTGCDSAEKELTVPSFTAPSAVITVESTGGVRTYRFTDDSVRGNIPITTRNWSFGDGGRASTTPATHTYAANGTYTVRLETCAGALCDTAEIELDVNVAPPTADFTFRNVGALAARTVEFTDASTAGDQPITSRQWSFGDNTFESNSLIVTHAYQADGVYPVTLRVCAGTLCNEITRNLTIDGTKIVLGDPR